VPTKRKKGREEQRQYSNLRDLTSVKVRGGGYTKQENRLYGEELVPPPGEDPTTRAEGGKKLLGPSTERSLKERRPSIEGEFLAKRENSEGMKNRWRCNSVRRKQVTLIASSLMRRDP